MNPCFWPEVRRGSERLARELADGLIRRGHIVHLITSHPGLPSRRKEDGLQVIRNWRPPGSRLRRRLFEDHLTHVPFSYVSLRRGQYDVAHALYPTDAVAAARWTARTGRPSVLSYMGIPHRRNLADRRWRIGTLRRALAGCSAVTSLSKAADAGFRRWLGVETRVIPPGVDLQAFGPGTGRANEPTVLFAASGSDPRKRLDLLVSAFAIVRARRHEARLLISSRDGDRVRSAGEGIELVNLDERAELVAAYRRASVTALPSVEEAFGLVLVESLACGTPVVASRSGALPEIVDRASIGRLFEGDDPEALAGALLEALDLSTESETAAACRQRAEEFRIERTIDAFERLYRELTESLVETESSSTIESLTHA
jgi:glycosyltransferase involved in cell wall biosynthesis